MMGDVGDTFRALKAHKKALKDKYGVLCSGCQKRFPKAHPKILLPGQRCFCGHRDSRPRLDDDPQYYMEQGHRRPISDERSDEHCGDDLCARVEVELQGITGEGVLTPRFTVEITGEMLMKIGRMIAMQKGLVPDEACDVIPVAVKFVHGET